MPNFEPVLLANIHKDDSHTLRVYQSSGGYEALGRVLREMSPADVVELVKEHPGPVYMCINADESEPGTFNNRILMEEDPHQVLEGSIISCYATRASTTYVYQRNEY